MLPVVFTRGRARHISEPDAAINTDVFLSPISFFTHQLDVADLNDFHLVVVVVVVSCEPSTGHS